MSWLKWFRWGFVLQTYRPTWRAGLIVHIPRLRQLVRQWAVIREPGKVIWHTPGSMLLFERRKVRKRKRTPAPMSKQPLMEPAR